MIKRNPLLLYRLIGYWFLYNCLLIILASRFHIVASTIIWLNCSLYFALGLLSLRIFISEKFNKDIFLNIGILFIGISISQVITLWYTHGMTIVSIQDFQAYQKMATYYGASFVIIYFSLKYLWYRRTIFQLYPFAIFLTICINFLYLYIANLHGAAVFSAEQPFRSLLVGNILSMSFIGIYAVKAYISDHPTGEYLHVLMIGLYFWVLRDLFANFASASASSYEINGQYQLLINLMFILVVLLKKLNYSTSEFGKFYENLIYSTGKVSSVTIQRRGMDNINFYLGLGQRFFYRYKNITIAFIAGICIHISTQLPFYQTLNLISHLVCIVLLFFFSCQLFRKRMERGNLLRK